MREQLPWKVALAFILRFFFFGFVHLHVKKVADRVDLVFTGSFEEHVEELLYEAVLADEVNALSHPDVVADRWSSNARKTKTNQ